MPSKLGPKRHPTIETACDYSALPFSAGNRDRGGVDDRRNGWIVRSYRRDPRSSSRQGLTWERFSKGSGTALAVRASFSVRRPAFRRPVLALRGVRARYPRRRGARTEIAAAPPAPGAGAPFRLQTASTAERGAMRVARCARGPLVDFISRMSRVPERRGSSRPGGSG